MLIGEDDSSTDVITQGTCFSMFVYIRARFRFVLIGRKLVLKLNLYFKLVPFRLLIHIILGSWIHRQYFVLAFMYVILECMIEFPEEMVRKKRI